MTTTITRIQSVVLSPSGPDCWLLELALMVMVVDVLSEVPLREAVTFSITDPAEPPAVKSVLTPVLGVIVPMVLLMVHTYVTVEGQFAVHTGTAENVMEFPAVIVGADGLIDTPSSTFVLVIVISTGPPIFLEVPSVAFTKSLTVPVLLPALNVTGLPVGELRAPSELVESVQAYVMVAPVQEGEQTGSAVNGPALPPVVALPADGLIDTDVRVTAAAAIVINAELLSTVTPSRVALAMRPTVPVVVPALIVVVDAVGVLTVPMDGFVSVQENVGSEGHVAVQAGTTVNALLVAPALTFMVVGETTAVLSALTVIATVLLTLEPPFSVAVT
jgi:hypothetical protein